MTLNWVNINRSNYWLENERGVDKPKNSSFSGIKCDKNNRPLDNSTNSISYDREIFHVICCMTPYIICCMILKISLFKCGFDTMTNKWFFKWFRNWYDARLPETVNDSINDSVIRRAMNDLMRSSRLQMFFKVCVLKNVVVLTEKHLCWNLFLIKLQAWRLQQRCCPVNIAKFLRTALFIEHLQWLVLFYE